MSKFFGRDSDTESITDEEVETKVAYKAPVYIEPPAVKRTIKSTDRKFQDDIENCVVITRNAMKIKDFGSLQDNFETMMKIYDRKQSEKVPGSFFKCLSELNNLVTSTWIDRNGRALLSKPASKALVALRQKLRKFIKNIGIDFENYQETKNEEITDVPSIARKSASEECRGNVSSTDSEFSESDSDSSSVDFGPAFNPRECFLKSGKGDEDGKERKKRMRVREKKADTDDDSNWETVSKGTGTDQKSRGVIQDHEEVTVALVVSKLEELMQLKSNKRATRMQQLECLFKLSEQCECNKLGVGIIAKVKLLVTLSILNYNPNFQIAMKADLWKKLILNLTDAIKLISEHQILLSDNAQEELENAPFKINCNLAEQVARVIERFDRIVRECDPLSMEYIDCMGEERKIMSIIVDAIKYYKNNGSTSDKCRIYLCAMRQMHYKINHEVATDMKDYHSYIYMNSDSDEFKLNAALYLIYFLALHDKWPESRDLMLMTHLQDCTEFFNSITRFYFNRATAQLGLCAFRNGFVFEALNILSDLIGSSRARELLGQGTVMYRQIERTKEQEQLEKQNHLPFHMHMNIEVLECVYFTSAMLEYIPHMAKQDVEYRRPMISKGFYQLLRTVEKQSLVATPESTREHVVAACRALKVGNWRLCLDSLVNPKMTKRVWKFIPQSVSVLENIKLEIQTCALYTFINCYGKIYDSLAISTLATQFDLSENVVRCQISKKIAKGQLQASLDATADLVILQLPNRRHVHIATSQLAEKVGVLLDNNERIAGYTPGHKGSADRQWVYKKTRVI